MSAHIRRIEAVEKDLKALRDASASKEDIAKVRTEMKKLYEGLHVGTCRIDYPNSVSRIDFFSQSSWTFVLMCGASVSILL